MSVCVLCGLLECSVAVKDGSRVVAGIPRFGLTFRFSLFSVSSFFFLVPPSFVAFLWLFIRLENAV